MRKTTTPNWPACSQHAYASLCIAIWECFFAENPSDWLGTNCGGTSSRLGSENRNRGRADGWMDRWMGGWADGMVSWGAFLR